MAPEAPEVLVRWEAFVRWLLARTEKLPKRLRFTITTRVDNLALDVFERLTEARYTRARSPLLARVNLDLQKLRLFLRLLRSGVPSGAGTESLQPGSGSGLFGVAAGHFSPGQRS